jgi:hypothetical protein
MPSFRAQREIPFVSADPASQPLTEPTQNSALSTQDSQNPPSFRAQREIPFVNVDPASPEESNPLPLIQNSELRTQNSRTGLDREYTLFQTTRQLTKLSAADRLGSSPLKNKDLQPQEVLA